eukprot:GDKI01036592.1.p1 GENE.GDKI01036592.1~~GDKI01036592.1.p1  ORF type:complete len:134 (+),score=17.44 GDKI01036592.1:313-714(+)
MHTCMQSGACAKKSLRANPLRAPHKKHHRLVPLHTHYAASHAFDKCVGPACLLLPLLQGGLLEHVYQTVRTAREQKPVGVLECEAPLFVLASVELQCVHLLARPDIPVTHHTVSAPCSEEVALRVNVQRGHRG